MGTDMCACAQVGNEDFNVYNMYDTCFPDNGLSLLEVRAVLGQTHLGPRRLGPWTHSRLAQSV